jgi:hypothetical protein
LAKQVGISKAYIHDLRRDEELQKGYSDEVKEPTKTGLRGMFG